MSEIRNLTRNGETFYPLTCTEGLVNRDGNVVGEINDIFDISEYNASGTPPVLATYSSLSLALAAVPQIKQKGGMTIRYVQTSDNKYVQWRLMSDSFNTTPTNWQGVDYEPTAESNNLVKSGGVYNFIMSTKKFNNTPTNNSIVNSLIKEIYLKDAVSTSSYTINLQRNYAQVIATIKKDGDTFGTCTISVIAIYSDYSESSFEGENNKLYNIVNGNDVVGTIFVSFDSFFKSKFPDIPYTADFATDVQLIYSFVSDIKNSPALTYSEVEKIKDIIPLNAVPTNNDVVNSVIKEIYLKGVDITKAYTISLQRNYTQVIAIIKEDNVQIGTATIQVIESISNYSDESFNSFNNRFYDIKDGSNNIIGKLYIITCEPFRETYSNSFYTTTFATDIPLNYSFVKTLDVNTIIKNSSLEENISDYVCVSDDVAINKIVKELYVKDGAKDNTYVVSMQRNYTQLIITLKNQTTDTEVGTCTIEIVTSSDWNTPIYTFDGQINKFVDGQNNPTGYIIIKRDYLAEILADYFLTAVIFTNIPLKSSVVCSQTCNPAINSALSSTNTSGFITCWNDKIIAGYGDSVSAVGVDGTKPYSQSDIESQWTIRMADYLGCQQYRMRSIPGTTNKMKDGGGILAVVQTSSGKYTAYGGLNPDYNVTYEEYLADPSIVTIPSGQEAICSCGCSWNRITKMFPAAIKDTIDAVFVFFHNDSGDNDAAAWVPSSSVNTSTWRDGNNEIVDRDWYNSAYYSDYNGDYNVYHCVGAFYSTIMKLQAWMPQALIILATPASTAGNNTSKDTSLQNGLHLLTENVRLAAKNNGVPLFDIFATDMINGRNRNLYVRDGIHPNVAGGDMLARAFASGFISCVPRF